ncbi:MAG: glycerate kinase [Planctomycetes bacterium]|nr:glycerate kinase [Planctomycetota bacterium]
MKIILAPDSFKGSLTAAEACRAMAEGVARACPAATVVSIPMADGGEGTADALAAATGGRMIETPALGPLGEPRTGRFALLGDGRTAVVEMAAVSGLPLVPPAKRNPLHTTTYGTGSLMAAAMGAGADHLIVGIGGSATTDLGAGMAQALGVRFLDAASHPLVEPMTGARLADVAAVDLSGLDPRLAACRIEVACDVDNPLLGPRGAAAVYGPQKGASPADIAVLEANLAHVIGLIERRIGRTIRDLPGAGAAGGLGAGLVGFCGASLTGGIDLVLAASRFAERLAGADLVLTGEGRLDATTARGKTISGILRLARPAGIPVIALAGAVVDHDALGPLGLAGAHAIAPADMPLEQAMAEGRRLLAETAERILRAWQRP